MSALVKTEKCDIVSLVTAVKHTYKRNSIFHGHALKQGKNQTMYKTEKLDRLR